MSSDTFVAKLLAADTEAEKAAIIALGVIDDLPEFDKKVARLASSLRWFNGEIIQALCQDVDANCSQDLATEIYQTLQELPFVEAVPNVGHRLHAQTAEGLHSLLANEEPKIVEQAHQIAAKVLLPHWDDDYVAQSVVHALFVSNQTEQAIEKFDELILKLAGNGAWENVLHLFSLREDATSLPFTDIPDYSAFNYFARAVAHSFLKQDNQAIADYDRAIQLNPDYATAYNNRGLSYSNKGDEDRAIADYDRAIQLNPDYATAYNNRGISYKNKGDYDRAIADYDRAIQLNPDDATAYNNRGISYKNKGD